MTTKTIITTLLFLMTGTSWATCNPDILLTKPDSIYIDNHNGTITDRETGLTWDKCSLGQTWIDNTPGDGSDDQCSRTPQNYLTLEAFDAVQLANREGHRGQSDWRMPNFKEIHSLAERACFEPAINTNRFPQTPINGKYVTSTHLSGKRSISFKVFYTMHGGVSDGPSEPELGEGFYIRLVRGKN